MGKLVSVFVCGVQKGGTTSLDVHFCEHPQLSPPRKKEVRFFDREKPDWSNPDYSLLDKFYNQDDGDRLRFDVSPDYIFWPGTIERIKTYNPSAKLIVLFRDPFERAWSNWCMVYAREKEHQLFADAIRGGRKRLDKLPPFAKKRRIYSYIERGLYAEPVRRVLANFPKRQVLFLRNEDFARDYKETLAKIAKFLGILPFPDTGPKRSNRRPKITSSLKPTAADFELIADLVRDDVLEFSRLTGLPVSDWPVISGNSATLPKQTDQTDLAPAPMVK